MSSSIFDTFLRIFELFSVSYGTIWYREYLQRKRDRKESNMDRDYIRKSIVMPILSDIRLQLQANRVYESVFSNGDTTFTGHHMKKISVISESNAEGHEDIGHHFQFIPTKKFERILDELYASAEDYIVFNEDNFDDDLSNLKKMFGLRYGLIVKIRDEINRWVGDITVTFDEPRELTDSEISFVKAMASRIGAQNNK